MICLQFRHGGQITPLPLRGLVSQSMPFELQQNDIFSSSDRCRQIPALTDLVAYGSILDTSIKRPPFADENIDLERGGQMNEIETTAPPHRIHDGSLAHVEFVLQRGNQAERRRFVEFRSKVHI